MIYEIIPGFIVGVYAIYHDSGEAYIGSSKRCIRNRRLHHLAMLRSGLHSCKAMQKLYLETDPRSWCFLVLEECLPENCRDLENYYIQDHDRLLNTLRDSRGACKKHSDETRQRMRLSRARYLETPGARESLAERARAQHAAGNFGRATWRS